MLHYNLYAKTEYQSEYSLVFQGLQFTYTVHSSNHTWLRSGFSYLFKISSTNKQGESVLSSASDLIYTANLPGEVSELRMLERSNTEISFAWQLPRDNGGAPILGYYVYVSEAGAAYQ